MPIAVEVVSKEKFAEWVRSKGGSLPGEKVAEATVPTAPAAAAPAAPATEAAPAAPATSQPATAQN
jgi:cytochrome c oxidase subunit 2